MELCRHHHMLYRKGILSPTPVTIIKYIINPTKQFCRNHQSLSSYQSKNVIEAEILHAKFLKTGSYHNLGTSNHLLNLYVKKAQNFHHAHKLFDEIIVKDVRSWTIHISGFAQRGKFDMGLDSFRRMQKEGTFPNQFTLSSVLKCCSSLFEIRHGKGIHGWIVASGVRLDVVLENSILDLYVKCGALDYAERFFESMKGKDTVSWNILIGGYLLVGDVEGAVRLFQSLCFKNVTSWNIIVDGLMRNGCEIIALRFIYEMVKCGPAFDDVTFTIALNLASSLLLLGLGKQIHGRVLRLVLHRNGFIRNSLLDMYCKCGKMDKASIIFSKMPAEVSCYDSLTATVSWSSMVSGYIRNGEYELALQTFRHMLNEYFAVDKFTLTSIISACANSGILELGRQIHAHIQKVGHKIDAHLGSSLINMYAKCGNLNDALKIFKQNNNSNVVLWTSMISGCALHGRAKMAVQFFEDMVNEGIRPNEITFLGVLTACNHAGLLEEGRKYFEFMQKVYVIKPGAEHYACMVDLYGRAGHLNEAKNFIQENGISHQSSVWKSLLSSCRLHKNFEIGKWVSERLFQLEKSDAGSYILSSNIYATDHRWEEAANIMSLMQQRKVNKLPGQSWIELKNQVHTFIMGDRSHPQVMEIYSYLEKLIGRLKEIGYSSNVKTIMQDVEEEQSELLLGFHSEKLVLAYALMQTSHEMPIRIMKNLRICSDCHNFMKYTSQLLVREITVRDLYRFHHFKSGYCSCGDYW